jgi:hypothetical protein
MFCPCGNIILYRGGNDRSRRGFYPETAPGAWVGPAVSLDFSKSPLYNVRNYREKRIISRKYFRQEGAAMKKINTARIITILTSLAFIGYGIIREEHLTVLKKAVNICLECIGIG